MLVSALAERVATQVECGFDFCLALGQDCVRTTTPREINHNSSVKDSGPSRSEKDQIETDPPSQRISHRPDDVQFDGDINILGSQAAVSDNAATPLEQPGSGNKNEHCNDTFAE